jgi:hypothetical protein
MEDYRIWYPYEVFYIESMLTITHTAMSEQLMLNRILKEINDGKYENRNLVIDLAQNIILQAASLSRYFWTSSAFTNDDKELKKKHDKIHKRRGQKLRESFNIHETNPIKNRNVRNFIEHFDAKLDLQLAQGIAGNIVPSYIGPKEGIDESVTHFFRAYYTDMGVFKVLNQNFEIIPIINELIRIHNLLVTFHENGGRLPKKQNI